MSMLTELRNRGVTDALVVCCDGLKGLPDAIRVTWPEATVQTCVVHLVRNSLRYASRNYPRFFLAFSPAAVGGVFVCSDAGV
jgi:putative transposase